MTDSTPPPWRHCELGTSDDDPVGCRGIRIPDSERCLAHADTEAAIAYLDSLAPGSDLDLRGTSLTSEMVYTVLGRCKDPGTGNAVIGAAWFDSVTFTGDARFESVTFTGIARFRWATFAGTAWFDSATFAADALFESVTFANIAWFESVTFTGDAWFGSAAFRSFAAFESATFSGGAWFGSAAFTREAWFGSATFTGEARFSWATFTGEARFGSATFTREARFDGTTFTAIAWFDSAAFGGEALFHSATFGGEAWFGSVTFGGIALFGSAAFTGYAWFGSATFTGVAGFGSATFTGNAHFHSATFVRVSQLGPLVCEGELNLSAASFDSPITIEAAVGKLGCSRTRWSAASTLWLRYAVADLSDAVFESPVTVAFRQVPFQVLREDVSEEALTGPPTVRVSSLRGVDAANLVLTDVDLSACRFSGTVHLDQLRPDGRCTFGMPPSGVHRRRFLPVRHTPRRVLAEEQHWRHRQARALPGWQADEGSEHRDVEPADLATTYRALRKSYEDASDEPGAADFYYGEMEMRRADRTAPRAERGLLLAYWALSGYGLRAARAFGWLLVAMTATVLLMMWWGVPRADTDSVSTGKVTGHQVTLTTSTPDPQDPQGPLWARMTGDRFEKSAYVVINSVVFRSSGEDLTTAGTYIEMVSRLSEPVLLGLAALAARGRIKR